MYDQPRKKAAIEIFPEARWEVQGAHLLMWPTEDHSLDFLCGVLAAEGLQEINDYEIYYSQVVVFDSERAVEKIFSIYPGLKDQLAV
jgi:hypothetical protein